MLRLASLFILALFICGVACTSSSGPSSTCADLGGKCFDPAIRNVCRGGAWVDSGSCPSHTGTQCCVGGPTNLCEVVGGTCIAVTPGACAGGAWGDAAEYGCAGEGVGCCVPADTACSPTKDTCAPNEWCAYADHKCGQGEPLGICRPGPEGCEEPVIEVCGCDGNVYQYDCYAHSARVDVSALGNCATPPGDFACGSTRFCTPGEYCIAGQLAPEGGCPAIPAACASTPTCDCIVAQISAACPVTCSGDAATGMTVTCE